MIVGIIGSGGREHAICESLHKSKKVNKLYCFPGNAGTSKIATNTMPFVIRGVKLWGIDSSGTSARRKDFVWNEVSKLIDFELIDSSIKEVSLNELLGEFPKMLKGELTGRILVNPNK